MGSLKQRLPIVVQLSKVFIELSKIYEEAPGNAGAAIAHRVRTDRVDDTPPSHTPYRFAINEEWWQEKVTDPEYSAYLDDWDRRPNPEGWDEAWANRNE
jgi:hypothetical protein